MLDALSGLAQASAQNGVGHFGIPRQQHARLHHVSTLVVGRHWDLWEWIRLKHQQIPWILGVIEDGMIVELEC